MSRLRSSDSSASHSTNGKSAGTYSAVVGTKFPDNKIRSHKRKIDRICHATYSQRRRLSVSADPYQPTTVAVSCVTLVPHHMSTIEAGQMRMSRLGPPPGLIPTTYSQSPAGQQYAYLLPVPSSMEVTPPTRQPVPPPTGVTPPSSMISVGDYLTYQEHIEILKRQHSCQNYVHPRPERPETPIQVPLLQKQDLTIEQFKEQWRTDPVHYSMSRKHAVLPMQPPIGSLRESRETCQFLLEE